VEATPLIEPRQDEEAPHRGLPPACKSCAITRSSSHLLPAPAHRAERGGMAWPVHRPRSEGQAGKQAADTGRTPERWRAMRVATRTTSPDRPLRL